MLFGSVALGISGPAAHAGRWELDPEFGVQGAVRLPKRDVWSLLARGPQRSLFVGGTRVCPPKGELESCPERPLVIARVSAQGRLLARFGRMGIVTLPITQTSLFASTGGKLLVAGTNRLGRLVVTRLNANGRPDSSFGQAGSAEYRLHHHALQAVGVEPDGDILIVAQGAVHAVSGQITFLRLLPSGALDRGFGEEGYLTPPGAATLVAPSGAADQVAFAGSGSILLLVEGLEANVGSHVVSGLAALEEFTAAGAPVDDFGSEGLDLLQPSPLEPSINGGFGLFALADGGAQVAFGGNEFLNAPKSEFGHEFRSYLDLFRITASGKPDPGFGRSGESAGLAPFESTVLEPNGDTLLIGVSGDDLVLGGVYSDGASDPALGGTSGQRVALDLGDGLSAVASVLAGSSMSLLLGEAAIVRLRD
jgi:uncharacterized delta-60 repeat protein